jgi:hypothetical protein
MTVDSDEMPSHALVIHMSEMVSFIFPVGVSGQVAARGNTDST